MVIYVKKMKIKENKMEIQKNANINETTKSKTNIKNKKKVHQCLFCSYSSYCSSNLNKHVNNVHTKNIFYNCKHCDKKYRDRSGVANHMKAQHLNIIKFKPHKCTMCDYTCSTKAILNQHINSIHTKDNLFSCDHCSLITTRKSTLKSHMVNMHPVDENKVRKYSCDHCSYTSKFKSCLLKHLNIHFRWKYYDCNICKRRFYNKKILKEHTMNVHAPDTKKYACNLCDYKALQPYKLKEHMNLVHIRAFTYCCDVPGCEAKYFSKKSLYCHKTRQHNKNPILHTCLHCNYQAKLKSTLKKHMVNRHLRNKELF